MEKTVLSSSNDVKNGVTDIAVVIQNYEAALNLVEKHKKHRDKKSILALLIARDDIENLFSVKATPTKEAFATLLDIDQQIMRFDSRLRRLDDIIASTINLDKWKQRFDCNDTQRWWWQFETPRQVNNWDRVDWLWDALTLAMLAIAASFIVSIISAISVGSLTVASTLSTIAQISGLAIVSQGALTKNGQQKVRDFMIRFRIPSRFQSEVMMIASFVLLATVYMTHQSLNGLYLEEGRFSYQQGNLGDAELTFMRGLEIEPDNSTYNAELGRIYESLGALDKAIEQYYFNVQSGGVKGINDLGRTYINWVNPRTRKNDLKLAEAYLLLALQRAETQNDPDNDLLYQVNRNLGWTLLKQEQYLVAKHYLNTAITLDESIPMNQIGGGMAYCFLAYVHEKEGKMTAANEQWKNCVVKARPETIHEYRWFAEVGKGDVASCVNTSKIVSGLDDAFFTDMQQTRCSMLVENSLKVPQVTK
ncbi:hypothetical protein MNBD_GAMMA16-1534 [hydrothermal vent metagenome]|uniref:Uncharacterized protein n=1 Tax=hydrothermal vent metagenome TaxID=652676 RepID=A0A3B0Z873_9ZZZZ